MRSSNNKENKESLKIVAQHSKNSNIQKNHLKLVAFQKISLAPKRATPINRKNPQQEQVNNDLTIKGDSLIKHKLSFSANKYSFKTNAMKAPIPLVNEGKLLLHKPSIHSKNVNKSQIVSKEKKKSISNANRKNETILKFGEILNIYEMEDKNININEEIDNFLKKLEKSQASYENFELILSLDWFDVKSSNSFETLIEKLIEYCLRQSTSNSKDFKSSQKRIICFILNGVEEFLFFEGISSTIFTNFTKLPFHLFDCLDFLMVFLQRNSKKLYFMNEEKLEFLVRVLIISFLENENMKITDEIFSQILQISDNLLKNSYIRMILFTVFQDFIKKLVHNCQDICRKNSTLVLKSEINLLLICLKYPDFLEKSSREEIIFNIINKLNSSLKIQREFPMGIIFTFKKIRKILSNFKLWEIRALDFETMNMNFSKMNLKGLLFQEASKTFKKMNLVKPFVTKK